MQGAIKKMIYFIYLKINPSFAKRHTVSIQIIFLKIKMMFQIFTISIIS